MHERTNRGDRASKIDNILEAFASGGVSLLFPRRREEELRTEMYDEMAREAIAVADGKTVSEPPTETPGQ